MAPLCCSPLPPPPNSTDLANRLLPLLKVYRDLWARRNRLGGLDDSSARLDHTLNCLLRKK